MPVLSEIESLALSLQAASAAYYNTGQPLMEDAAYDRVVDRLRALAPDHPQLKVVGAPATGKKVRHQIAMMSLNKATTEAELTTFHEEALQAAGQGVSFVVEPKLDGASLELIYEGAKLVRAITRGDGEVGQDVTETARRIPEIPQDLKPSPHLFHRYGLNCSVRGECLLSLKNWEQIKAADPTATNPRNVGTGILLRSSGAQAELLHFRPFDLDIITKGVARPETEEIKMAILESLGFTVPEFRVAKSIGAVTVEIEMLRSLRPDYDYAIDGAVVKVNAVDTQDRLGVSSGRPNGQIAFKWESEQATTELIGLELSVGHTGFIIPTGILKPVFLMGTTVSRVLLNNWDEIGRLDVALGDTVRVSKRGDIIPKVEKVLSRPATRTPLIEPKVCPACGGKAGRRSPRIDDFLNKTLTVQEDTGKVVAVDGVPFENASAQTFCLNELCGAKVTGKVKRWLTSLDILGIGDELLKVLTTEQLNPGMGRSMRPPYVGDPADLYQVKASTLQHFPMGKGKVGIKRATSIVQEIDRKRTLTLAQFLGSLGLPFLGKRRVELICQKAQGGLDTLQAWMGPGDERGRTLLHYAEQCEIAGMAPTIQAAIDANRGLIDRLVQQVTVLPHSSAPKTGRLSTTAGVPAPTTVKTQFTFVLTGKFDRPKAEIHAEIVAAGHTFADELRKGETTHLVQADPSSTSNKSQKAAGWGVPVIGLDQLEALLK